MIYQTRINHLIVREASLSDVNIIAKLIKELAKYEKRMKQVKLTNNKLAKTIFVNKEAEVLIAELKGKPIGFALFYKTYSTFLAQSNMYLEDIFVIESERNKGIGKAMFRVLAKIAKKRNYQRFEWSCLKWNKPSLEFYKKLGAKTLDGWLVHRLTTKEINKLASELKN